MPSASTTSRAAGRARTRRTREFFAALARMPLKNARLAAFGSTRRAACLPRTTPTLRRWSTPETPAVTLVGKTWDFHVERGPGDDAGREPRDDRGLGRVPQARRTRGRLDAEHFFDGFRANPAYALAVLVRRPRRARTGSSSATRTAARCPAVVGDAVAEVRRDLDAGRHPRPQRRRARRGELAGRRGGRAQVQGTSTATASASATRTSARLIPNLELKLG